MPTWTTGELRRMRQAHVGHCPTEAELAALFDRHSPDAVVSQAQQLGLRHRQRQLLHWLRVAHLHFAAREAASRTRRGVLQVIP